MYDYIGLGFTAVVVLWGAWKIFFYDFPRPPPIRPYARPILHIIGETITELEVSLAENERHLVRLEKLVRRAQQAQDAETMQETLMMYSEQAKLIATGRDRLEHFKNLYEIQQHLGNDIVMLRELQRQARDE